MDLVDRFNIVFDTEDTPSQVIQFNATSITIPLIPGLSYSGNISAVSICGRESEPLQFEGRLSQHVCIIGEMFRLLRGRVSLCPLSFCWDIIIIIMCLYS